MRSSIFCLAIALVFGCGSGAEAAFGFDAISTWLRTRAEQQELRRAEELRAQNEQLERRRAPRRALAKKFLDELLRDWKLPSSLAEMSELYEGGIKGTLTGNRALLQSLFEDSTDSYELYLGLTYEIESHFSEISSSKNLEPSAEASSRRGSTTYERELLLVSVASIMPSTTTLALIYQGQPPAFLLALRLIAMKSRFVSIRRIALANLSQHEQLASGWGDVAGGGPDSNGRLFYLDLYGIERDEISKEFISQILSGRRLGSYRWNIGPLFCRVIHH